MKHHDTSQLVSIKVLVCKDDVVGLVGKVKNGPEDVCTYGKRKVTQVGGAQRDTKEDNDVEPEEGVATKESTVGLGDYIVLNKYLLQDVQVAKDEDNVDSADVHVEDLYTEAGIVKHFFSELNNQTGFWDVVSPKEEAGEELEGNGQEEHEANN